MPSDQSPKINGHVARLNRFLPFSAAHDQIYEEYQTGDDSLDLPTIALQYTQKALKGGARCIVLTGDAGHGKTHLCRKLIEEYLGYTSQESREILVTQCNGQYTIGPKDGLSAIKLRVHKDYSELNLESAVDLIERAPSRENEVLIICANEGRLRAVVNSSTSNPECKKIAELFKQSFNTGLSSIDGKTHIVNLNYQSVAAKLEQSDESLLTKTFQSWVNDGRRWTICNTCSLSAQCPIKNNRYLLAESDELSKQRISKIEELCEVIERLGHVITIREMLMLVSFLITGGMTCSDILNKCTSETEKTGWQHTWAFYNVLFNPPVPEFADRIYKGIPILSVFRKLDPGSIASRAVDEKILNIGEVFPFNELDLQFSLKSSNKIKIVDASQGIDDFMGNPQNKAEQIKENETTAVAVRALRRRALFDDTGEKGTLMSRLGFRHGDSFLGMIKGCLTPTELVKLKNMIISGLHAIQGLRMSKSETTLHLVDPAFGKASADAAIIARRIPTNHLQMLPASKAWNINEKNWNLNESVDWIDRTIVIRVQENGQQPIDIALDLLAFECVTRSASGYVSEEFYSHEIRRIRSFLGRLAALGKSEGGEISLFMKGRVHNVSIDMDVIQVGGV